jgi:hypothetical protein
MKYNISENNGMWKGNEVGYSQLHVWIRTRIPKPELCPRCNQRPPHDLANKGVYNRDLNNWEWLCRKCHMNSDGRMKNLDKTHIKTRTLQSIKAYNKKWYLEHREEQKTKKKEHWREWYSIPENREIYLKREKERYIKNKKIILERQRINYKKKRVEGKR